MRITHNLNRKLKQTHRFRFIHLFTFLVVEELPKRYNLTFTFAALCVRIQQHRMVVDASGYLNVAMYVRRIVCRVAVQSTNIDA